MHAVSKQIATLFILKCALCKLTLSNFILHLTVTCAYYYMDITLIKQLQYIVGLKALVSWLKKKSKYCSIST